ncbi:hypothetical protein [Crossiella sp. CA198]|uniref:hypothetical protein n=1 Tax=Crossiella sp. CA198 TaxID=3455607 RepID=UPI003F8D3094
MPLRPCLGTPARRCGQLTPAARCRTCAAEVELVRTQGKRTRRPYTAAERTRRARAVAAHRAQHGDICPGWEVPAHRASDLTADHHTPVGAGGQEGGALGVLCRSCNGRKGARPDRHDQ